MMYKRIGSRIEVRRYEGYDKDKKRSDVKLLGSFNAHTLDPAPELLAKLTDEQKAELQSYIDGIKQEQEDRSLQYAVKLASQYIKKACDSIRKGVVTDDAEITELANATTELNRLLGNLKRRKKTAPPAPPADADKSSDS